jgi:hypothetical protein
MLKDVGIIVFRPSNWVDAVDEAVVQWNVKLGVASRGKHWRTSGGREDGQCDIEDEIDYYGCCLCSIWMFSGDVCCKEVIQMLNVVLLLHLCG